MSLLGGFTDVVFHSVKLGLSSGGHPQRVAVMATKVVALIFRTQVFRLISPKYLG